MSSAKDPSLCVADRNNKLNVDAKFITIEPVVGHNRMLD